MKQSDLAMLILIVSISLVASYFVGNALFVSDETRTAEVRKTEKIVAEFPQPDPDVFHEDALNLTEKITIGNSRSDKPFSDDD